MTTKDNSGPAFPRADDVANSNAGMSLRDWFAGQALAGLAVRNFSDGNDFMHREGPENAAEWAYAFADAMLEARK
jgi:hypothetical protein